MSSDVIEGTASDLVADARRARLEPVSERLVTDWVTLGLLGSPARQGAGRGHGSRKAVFSANQRQLFVALLKQRKVLETVKKEQRALPRSQRARETRIGLLTRIPLVLWAYWGDEYVDTEQARRALATSLDVQVVPKERARKRARTLVGAITHPDASDTAVNKLVRLLATAMQTGHIQAPADFDQTFRRVFDPMDIGRPVLPPGIPTGQSATPSQMLQAEVLREGARMRFRSNQVSDQLLEQTRVEMQTTLVEYASGHPLYAALAGQRLMDVVAHHEFAQLTNSITDDLWLTTAALLRSREAATEGSR